MYQGEEGRGREEYTLWEAKRNEQGGCGYNYQSSNPEAHSDLFNYHLELSRNISTQFYIFQCIVSYLSNMKLLR